ncbi:MAG: BlaI/MecI/CopY family transcriptional regulator [Bacillota bacterium]|uniref:Predicted transcriptional regulator n=2 Tax=Carboxydocella TaxID=178898 RepID=A0A1T4M319_9FIRM|nr:MULTISPECIES: BlaI/MecI/CopY family transcriptional regulator [Carboxydocella]AVX21068.1 putative transcriptional regulator [Carboxydocella thermautotrophica]AVX31488.1 putative transcriptional regulator [Carboxydocella thermautotrophica]GAW32767.1 transcriptional repressor, CopY family [Carboxydocella sp. JDF658]SJZ61277.1 Predicted transcriptional regulator [Carboxydocella sporoproducens DSM 16521]
MFWRKLGIEFKPHKTGLSKVLGELEAEIMEIVWQHDRPVTVREVYEELRERRSIAYTTVMTIMSRLAEKELLQKTQESNYYLYSPVYSREEFTTKVVSLVLDGLLADFAQPVLSHLVEKIQDEDEEKLAQLEQLIRERRAKGGK